MNDLLRQLMQLGPGIGAGLAGNGPAMQSFMEGWERARQADEQRKRLQQQDGLAMEDRQLALEDRQRNIGRQETADAASAQERQQRQALQQLQIPGQLAEMGSAAPDAQSAQALIESAMPNLMKVFGQEAMAYGQPAVNMAQQTITGRQKKQVEAYVEEALKTAYVADNPNDDPELVDLPEHIVRMLGKPTAKLSELQRFAQLPIGKPAGKTRVPAAGGSFEDYIEKAYGPNPTAEQILAGRKAYQQSDDRAPRVTVNTGDGIDRASALKFQDDYARDSKPYLTMREAYQRVKSAKPDAAGDLSLIFAYMKILDPNSVVREQEFANAQNAAGVPARIRNTYNKVMEGTRLAPEQRAQFQAQAEALFEGAKTNQRGVRKTYSDRAAKWKIPADMVLDEEDEFLRTPTPDPNASQPRPAAPRKNPFRPQ
jgi:hypothetical protein